VYQAHGEELVRINRQRIELITWAFTKFWMVDVFPLCKFLAVSIWEAAKVTLIQYDSFLHGSLVQTSVK
jgi:hypothetical protein